MKQKNGKNKLEGLFSQFLGKPARNVKLGHGSFITIDFGKNLTLKETIKGKERTYTQGEWHLWIIMSAWRLDVNGVPLITCESSREKIDIELKKIENKKLINFQILNPAFDADLIYENEIILHLFSWSIEKDSKQWMLFTPERKIFTAGPSQNWTFKASSKN